MAFAKPFLFNKLSVADPGFLKRGFKCTKGDSNA